APGISYDASYIFSRAKLKSAHLNDFSVTRLGRSLDVVTDPSTGLSVRRSVRTDEDPDCVPWDIFEIGGVSQAATDYLNFPSHADGAVTQNVANVNATVDLGEWGLRSPWSDEGPSFNLGAEYRKDKLDYQPDEAALSGDLAGSPKTPVITR